MSNRSAWVEAEQEKKILKQKQQDAVEAEKTKMDKKAERLVLERRMEIERVETEMEEQVKNKLKEGSSSVRGKEETDGRFAAEMSRLCRDEAREKKLREHMRECGEELKVMENKLRAAYVSKQLFAQMAEKKVTAAQEKLEKQKIQEMIEAEKRCMEEVENQRAESLRAEKLRYKEDLLNQIKEGNKKQQDAERDLVLEKALLKEAMRKLQEESEREKRIRMEKLKNTRQEIQEFQREKERRKQSEKHAAEEEEKRLKAYLKIKEMEEENRIKYLKEKEAMKNKMKDKLIHAYLSRDQSEKEREEILTELAEEEIRQRNFKKDKEKVDAAKKIKEDFQNAFNKNLKEKEIGWIEDYKDQELYRHQLLDDIEKEAKLGKSSENNKDIKSKELREFLLQQIKEKHRRKIEEWQTEAARSKMLEVEEKERMKIVEEERLEMLKTHAAKLVGYLPRGVLRQSDFVHLGPELLGKRNKSNTTNCS